MRYLRILNMCFITKSTFLLLLPWCFPGTIIWSSNYHNFILMWVIKRMYQGSLCEMLCSVFNFRAYFNPLWQGPVAAIAGAPFWWRLKQWHTWSVGHFERLCPQLATGQRSPPWDIFSEMEVKASLNLMYLASNCQLKSQGSLVRVAKDSCIC